MLFGFFDIFWGTLLGLFLPWGGKGVGNLKFEDPFFCRSTSQSPKQQIIFSTFWGILFFPGSSLVRGSIEAFSFFTSIETTGDELKINYTFFKGATFFFRFSFHLFYKRLVSFFLQSPEVLSFTLGACPGGGEKLN